MRVADEEPGGLEAKCTREHRGRCLQAKAYPDERFEWELEIRPRCDDRDCPPGTPEPDLVALVAVLLEHGGYGLHLSGRRSVRANLSHADVLAAASLDAVVRISVECGESMFCSCADLPATRCGEHAFCSPIEAQAMYASCTSRHLQAIGCAPASRICGSAMTDVRAPDGTAWRLTSTCMPSAPGWEVVEWTDTRPCADR